MKNLFACTLLAAAVFGVYSSDASAAVEDLQNVTNASSICHGVRPVDEAKVSANALVLRNDGTTTAFVTCAFTTTLDQGGGGGVTTKNVNYFGAFFSNANAEDATVKCTGIQGFANDSNNVYETLTTNVPANNAPGTPTDGYIFFGPESPMDPLYYQNVSMTCLLPPGVSIADTYVGYKLDDGPSPVANAAP